MIPFQIEDPELTQFLYRGGDPLKKGKRACSRLGALKVGATSDWVIGGSTHLQQVVAENEHLQVQQMIDVIWQLC